MLPDRATKNADSVIEPRFVGKDPSGLVSL